MGKATDSTSRFGRIAGGAAKAGLVALGAGAVAAGFGLEKAIQAGSDMNETLNKVNVVFGKAQGTVLKFGEQADTSLGLSKQAALDAAATFGTFGKSAGLSGQKLASFSDQMLQAAGDLASFHNADPSQVLEDIRSGLAGEVEPLRKYGILLNDATLRQQAMKMGLVDSTKNALSPANKMLAAQALILKDLGPAAGDFARTSGGLANQQRIMKAELQNVVSEIGTALLPIVLKVAQFALPLMIDAIKAAADGIKGAIKWVSQIASHFQILGGKSESAGNRIHNAWQMVVAFFRGNVMPIIRQLRGIFQDSMAAIAKVVQQHGDEVRRIMDRVGAALKGIAKVAIPILRFALVTVLPRAIGVAITAIDKISAAVETIVNWFITLYNQITSVISKLGEFASKAKSAVGTSGIDVVSGLFGHAAPAGATGGASTGRMVAAGGRQAPTIVNLHLDGKVFYSAMVKQDTVFKRQNGRSALA